MKGNVFLIGGFDIDKTATHEDYRDLRNTIGSKGYKVIAVDIYWKNNTMSKFARQFMEFYKQRKGKHNIIIGNSFGAEIALITASELKPQKIILCSLSPFFKEDIPTFSDPKKLVKWFGPRRLKDLEQISVKAAVEQINDTSISTVMLYGEKEKEIYKKLVKRVRNTAKDIKGAKLMEVTSAGHSFKDSQYIQAICQYI